jgi:hypothetical protein
VLADAGQLDDPADCSARGDGQPQFGAVGGGLVAGLDQVIQAGGVAEAGGGQVGDNDGDTGSARGGDQVQDVAGIGDVDLRGQRDEADITGSLITGTDLLIPVREMPEKDSPRDRPRVSPLLLSQDAEAAGSPVGEASLR